ncbi:DUF5302 domain-containing protein [Actinokineospora sp. G85]|uniref:DUF5302 domain-containing protein n=1 Tax=Actinokineospora sp. G85 TaxID=3406626 RepID=UPI003C71A93D
MSQDQPDAQQDSTEPEDLKSKFKAALERKQAKSQAGQEHTTGGSKVGDAHGRAGGRRQFRRKSG